MKGYFVPEKKDFLNVPNLLSLLRILLIPIFIALYMNGYKAQAIVVLLVSGFSDMADGIIARRFNQITDLGKLLDPLADKLNQGAIAVCLAVTFAQLRPLLIILAIKELSMLTGGVLLLRGGKRPIASKWWGKLSTIVFYTVVAAILIFGENVFGISMSCSTVAVLAVVACLFLLFSFINYIPMFLSELKSLSDSQKNRK